MRDETECVWCGHPIDFVRVVAAVERPTCSARCAAMLIDAELRRLTQAREQLRRQHAA